MIVHAIFFQEDVHRWNAIVFCSQECRQKFLSEMSEDYALDVVMDIHDEKDPTARCDKCNQPLGE